MPSNLVERVHTPAFMQGIALGFRTPMLVADIVAPRIRVSKQSDKFRKWGKDSLYIYESTWAPGSIPNAIKTELADDTYFAEIRKLRHQLLDTEVRNADADLDLRTRYTERVVMATQLARESRVATLFTTTGNYPGGNVITKTGGTEWNHASVLNTVGPITDMETQIAVAEAAVPGTPRSALTVLIPNTVFTAAIRHNSAIRDYFKYTAGGVMSEDILASLLGVGRVLLVSTRTAGTGVQNAALDIVTGITTTELWGDNVWIGLVDDSANDLMYSFARSFHWAEETGGQDIQIRQYRASDGGQEADWIEAKEAIGEKIVANFAGTLMTNLLV